MIPPLQRVSFTDGGFGVQYDYPEIYGLTMSWLLPQSHPLAYGSYYCPPLTYSCIAVLQPTSWCPLCILPVTLMLNCANFVQLLAVGVWYDMQSIEISFKNLSSYPAVPAWPAYCWCRGAAGRNHLLFMWTPNRPLPIKLRFHKTLCSVFRAVRGSS